MTHLYRPIFADGAGIVGASMDVTSSPLGL
jgi:hypothetical protein